MRRRSCTCTSSWFNNGSYGWTSARLGCLRHKPDHEQRRMRNRNCRVKYQIRCWLFALPETVWFIRQSQSHDLSISCAHVLVSSWAWIHVVIGIWNEIVDSILLCCENVMVLCHNHIITGSWEGVDSGESRLVEIWKSKIWIVVGTSRFVRFKLIDFKEVPNTLLMIFMWFGERIRPH